MDTFITDLCDYIHDTVVNPMIAELSADNGDAEVNLVALRVVMICPDGDLYDYIYDGDSADLGGFLGAGDVPMNGEFVVRSADATFSIEGDATQKGYEIDQIVREGYADDIVAPILSTHIRRNIENVSSIDVASFINPAEWDSVTPCTLDT